MARQPRPLLSTPHKGWVAVDATLLALWQCADGADLNDLARQFPSLDPFAICVALTCLVRAQLLEVDMMADAPRVVTHVQGDLVSVILVTHNSRVWLPDCFASLARSTYSPLEIIVVDNGSTDDSVAWIKANSPQARIICLVPPHSLAHAINVGVGASRGTWMLVLNPDTRVGEEAIAELVAVARHKPRCAAVAAKLKLASAPAFLNGLGNYVGGFYWSTDNGLGHLDLGQFDELDEIPSACFAAALIPRPAWEAVGPLDEKFPLYYEDSEWCYRARVLGYAVYAAPRASVDHAMGGHAQIGGVSPRVAKIEQVAQGRLRFAVKLLGLPLLVRYLTVYLVEDILWSVLALVQFRGQRARARMSAWRKLLAELPRLLAARRVFGQHRLVSDARVFRNWTGVVAPLVWRGLPELTWNLVQAYYAPLFRSGKAQTIPGLESASRQMRPLPSAWHRITAWRQTMNGQLILHRLWRWLQWQLK